MRALRISLKLLAWIVGVLLLLLLTAVVAIRFPVVQNKALTWLTPTLARTLGGANIEIEYVDIDFFDAAQLDRIYIEDLAGDTLIYASELKLDIGLFRLFAGELVLDKIELNGALVNAYQGKEDSAFNYQFILDAFASSDTTTQDTAASAFVLDIKQIALNQSRIKLLDEKANTTLSLNADRIFASFNSLDINALAIDLKQVDVEGLDADYFIGKQDTTVFKAAFAQELSTTSEIEPARFPFAGMPIAIEQLSLKQVNLAYRNENAPQVAAGFDANNIAIQQLSANASAFAWDSTQLILDWNALSFREHSGLEVDKLAFSLAVTPEAFSASDVVFQTPSSQVLAKANLSYSSFSDLLALDKSVELSLQLSDTYLAFSELKVLAPMLEDAGVNLSARESITADGRISGSLANVSLEGINLRLGSQTSFVASGFVADFLDPEKLRYSLKVARISSSYRDLKRFTKGLELPEELAGFGQFRFSGNISGSTKTFVGNKLAITTAGTTSFTGNLSLQNIDNPASLFIDASGVQLITTAAEVAGFLPDSLGIDFLALGDVRFNGDFNGTLTDFSLDGRFQSAVGKVSTSMVAAFEEEYSTGTYKGSISMDTVQLGRLLQDSTLGAVTLKLSLDGSGIQPADISSRVEGGISSFTLFGYDYKDIQVDGRLDKQVFKGSFSIDDENIALAFEGMVNMRDSIPDMEFFAQLDTLALQPLGLYDTPLGMKFSMTADLAGNNADNLSGKLRVDSFYLQDLTSFAFLPKLTLRSGDTVQGRFIDVNSAIVKASIIGDYTTSDLPALLVNYINDFSPIDEYVNTTDRPADLSIEPQPQPVLTDQRFDYKISLHDPLGFIKIFDPELRRLDTVSLSGNFDTQRRELSGRLYIPNLDYAGTTIDTLLLNIGGDISGMLVELRSQGIEAAGQEIELALVNATLRQDSLQVDFQSFLQEDSLLVGTGLSVHMNAEKRYVIRVDQDLEVAGQVWKVNPGNSIEYWNNFLRVSDLEFSKEGQQIQIASTDESSDENFAPISVTISNYDLREVARLIQLEGFSLEGRVNGTLGIREPGDKLYYVANIDVDDIVLNESEVGKLVVHATSENLENTVAIDVRLSGPINEASLAGEYGIEDGDLDLLAKIRAFDLRVIDPLTVGILSESKGLLRADMAISGTVDKPVVDGYLQLDGAETTFDLLGTRLKVEDSRVDFNEEKMDFGTFVLADSLDQKASLSGTIDHDYFSDFQFDLRLQTQAFTVLNTKPSLSELYFGKAVVSADLVIGGNVEIPVVRGRVSTLSSTNVSIVPLISSGGVSEESWIVYGKPEEIEADTTLSLKDIYSANALGLDLALVVNVQDDALLNVIIDPATGDALQARGDAELNVQMTPQGEISVTGLYTITKGAYQFTLATGGFNVKQYDFDIKEGSTMRFVGDPLASRFDITAVYATQTSSYPLLQPYLADNDPELERAKNRQTVNILMTMKGDLEKPDIKLDISLPEATGTAVTSKTRDVLNSLSDQEIYAQVFSLLLFNSFQGSSGSGFDPAAQGTQLAISSISNLVSNQLNSLADNYIKGIDINVGIESYENQYLGGRQNTANLDISKSLFNDRLTITLGTDVNVSQSQTAGSTQAAGIQSNFVLTYKLTESGRYVVRVFRRPDVDIIMSNTSYETGTGVSYQRSFD